MERIKRAMEKARASAPAMTEHIDTKSVSRLTPAGVDPLTSSDINRLSVDAEQLEHHRIIAGNKDDPRTTSFDLLRTQVLREMQKNGFRTLVVTSPTPDCGKTTVAINLAFSVAQLAEPMVLLGDLDFRRPKIASYLGIRANSDLSDLLEKRAPLKEAIIGLDRPRLLVLPNKKVHRNASEMLTSPEMSSFVASLRSDDATRICIFDLPPMLPTDDTIAFLPQADCALLVVEDGSTKKPDLEEALRLLEGTALLGVVLNKSDTKLRPYY